MTREYQPGDKVRRNAEYCNTFKVRGLDADSRAVLVYPRVDEWTVRINSGDTGEWLPEWFELDRPEPGSSTPPTELYPLVDPQVGDIVWSQGFGVKQWCKVTAVQCSVRGIELKLETPDVQFISLLWYPASAFVTDLKPPTATAPVATQPVSPDEPPAPPATPQPAKKPRPRWVIRDINSGDYIVTSSKDYYNYVSDLRRNALLFSSPGHAFQFRKTLLPETGADFRVFKLAGTVSK